MCSRLKIQENVFGAFAVICNLSTMHFVIIYGRIAMTVFIDLTVVMIMTKTMVTISMQITKNQRRFIIFELYI